jgi:hypothetical protein
MTRVDAKSPSSVLLKFHQIEARRDEIALVAGAIPGLGKVADGAVVRPASNRT